MKTPAEIRAAATRIVHERLRHGVSEQYCIAILDRDPAWTGEDMAEIKRVRLEVSRLFDAYLDQLARGPGLAEVTAITRRRPQIASLMRRNR
ncbi:hypothetical protein [Nocardia wallacei]|uniref:hypothetical protein n=1 Tax=Nocardia wallacei TaxID=480035 RepID=UPI002454929B|nr:hypothetical protein [Nocardia wallacei]